MMFVLVLSTAFEHPDGTFNCSQTSLSVGRGLRCHVVWFCSWRENVHRKISAAWAIWMDAIDAQASPPNRVSLFSDYRLWCHIAENVLIYTKLICDLSASHPPNRNETRQATSCDGKYMSFLRPSERS